MNIDPNSGVKQKALKINLDPNIFGTFAEIGAGQEVANHFFKAGASSGTVANLSSKKSIYSSPVNSFTTNLING